MRRTRIVFSLIVVAALVLIGLALVFNAVEDDLLGGEPGENVPGNAVAVLVATSNTKQTWMDQMVEQFNAAGSTTADGQPVHVSVQHVGSGSSMEAILVGDLQPVVWSPGSGTWVERLNQTWQDRYSQSLTTGDCPATINAPLGIAMWQPMAEALGWPEAPISWQVIADLAADPDGWATLDHPEWGDFRFGHGHPAHSNSGMLSVIAAVYAAADVAADAGAGLAPDDVWAEDVMAAVGAVETAVYHYGRKDTDLLARMTLRGPSYLHAVTTYEGNVIRWNQEHAEELRFPLVMIYPADGTFWVDNPYCILNNAEWVTEAQQEGAALFRDFILAREQQEGLIATGLRPALADIALHDPISLDYGAVPTVTSAEVPALAFPSDEVADHITDMWYQVKKPATVLVIIDVSGSMEGAKMQSAATAAQEFIDLMQPQDVVSVIAFHDKVMPLQPSGTVGSIGEELKAVVGGLIADGGTALYHVTMEGIAQIDQMQAADLAEGEERIYSIVLMTDGQNYAEDGVTESQMLSTLPDGLESDAVRLYTIAYGEDANADLLATIANRTNGKTFTSTPDNIRDIYFLISSEF